MTLGAETLVLFSVLAVGQLLFGGGVLLMLRSRDAAAQHKTAEPQPAAEADLAPVLAGLEARLAGIELGMQDSFKGLRDELAALKADIEWLAGERMVEQAIALARTGLGPDEISLETGLSADAVRTISLFRRH